MFILPSLGRPSSVDRFLKAYRETRATAPVVVWVGANDQYLEDYRNLEYPFSVNLHVDVPMRVGEVMQAFYRRWPNEPVYGYLADDVVPRTLQWDREIADACGNWGFVTVNEGLPDEAVDEQVGAGVRFFRQKRWPNQPDDLVNSNFPMVGGELVRALGGFMVAPIQHFETDVFWQRVAVTLNVHQYREDIVLEHMHHSLGKSDFDDTYLQYEDDAKSSGYGGWRKDLLSHLAWWSDMENLRKLDRIKRKINGSGLEPLNRFVHRPLEQLQRTHLGQLTRTETNFHHAGEASNALGFWTEELLTARPTLADGLVLEREQGVFTLWCNESNQRLAMNHSAALILACCAGEATTEDIAAELVTYYRGENSGQVRHDVLNSIERLYQFGILECVLGPPAEQANES